MTPHLPPYPTYKPSGVEWLGEVPAHWEQLPGRACYTEKKVLNVGMQESTVLSLSYGRIVVRPPEKLRGLVPESFETYQIIEPGDIVVRATDLQNDWNSLRFGLCGRRGIITSAYICLKANGVMSRDYGHLLLHSYDLKKVFYGLGSGLRQNLSWDDFRYLPCLAPPLAEQRAIARYLDHVDSRIQRYIKAKEQLIALLQEARQAIIQRAVTRGLDPDVPLKPSGVDWLGDVPAHWEVRRTKQAFKRIVGGSTPSSSEPSYWDGEIVWVTPTDISKQSRLNDSLRRITKNGLDNCSTQIVPAGSIVISCRAPVGNVAFAKVPLCTNQGCKALVPWNQVIESEYAFRLFSVLQEELQSRANGTTFAEISTVSLGKLLVPLPPLQEQRAIAAYLDQATAAIDSAIDNTRCQVEFIREYRASLIAHVVTGKLDVRAAAAQLPTDSPAETPVPEQEKMA